MEPAMVLMRFHVFVRRLAPSGNRTSLGYETKIASYIVGVILMRVSARSTKRQTAIEEHLKCRVPLRAFAHSGCIDSSKKNRDFLVSQSGRRQIAEQFHRFFRGNTDFLSTFPPRSIDKSFVRLDPSRDELDQIAVSVGEMR